jgi:tRNA A-37 threonylcarbamoyl transferase component Bud32
MNEELLFHEALGKAPAERAAFLDAACTGQPGLRAGVESLLREHQAPGHLLDRPALQVGPTGEYPPTSQDGGATARSDLKVNQIFAGRYKLREKLGVGGMGEVWVADQIEPVEQRVALKVIKAGMDSARQQARFEQERQTLAVMDHPNIAKVFDAGIDESGRAYFVMELIKGVPLTTYCDEARLTPRQRLELFIAVCQAVQHAHQKGIIHRDLKPSNILVGLYDGKPAPKVIDFGVAKATGRRLSEQTVYTEVGSLIGTLEYMSPEQAELNNLDIDTRSDIRRFRAVKSLHTDKSTGRPGRIGVLHALLIACATLAIPGPAATFDPGMPAVIKAEHSRDWNARFAGTEGWIGGDGASSAILGSGRVLWFFGDTLLGKVKDGGRHGAVMVNNTVAVQRGRGKDVSIRFLAGKAKDGKPASVFTPGDGKGWVWPQGAAQVGRRLVVFLAQIERTNTPGVFGFRQIGQWLAVVDNPDDQPDTWRVNQHRIPFATFEPGRERSLGSAVLNDGNYLYVYGYFERGHGLGKRQLLVARVPASTVTEFSSWQFRTADGWASGPAQAAQLAGGLATDFSVSRLPGSKRFILAYTENGLGDRVVGRFADAAVGPWSAPVLLYRCPEGNDKSLFCYSGRVHGWAPAGDGLLVSYCVNAWEFGRLFRDEKVYRPKFVRVRLGPRPLQ